MRGNVKKSNSSQQRLNRFANELLQDNDMILSTNAIDPSALLSSLSRIKPKSRMTPMPSSSSTEKKTSASPSISTGKNKGNWRSMLASSGNNIFGQMDVHQSLADLHTLFTLSNTDLDHIERIFSGYNLTASITSQGDCYIWGMGLPGMQSKIPRRPLLPLRNVTHVSCGQSHVACINDVYEVYTWGQDEFGCLGHGKLSTAVMNPKQVETFRNMKVTKVSCGGYHTGFICASGSDSDYGDVYMCGQGKGGQLGLGEEILSTSIPNKLDFLQTLGFKSCSVACGLHHTLILAMNINERSAMRQQQRHYVLSYGFGEAGRLGVNDESPCFIPTEVLFPIMQFNPLFIGAGESHSVACGVNSCYSWGNNEFCQLGNGSSPDTLDCSLTPVSVAIPDSLIFVKLSVGSRHSGVLTQCGKLLTWGWGEEGQCGNGKERDTHFPRPVRLPRVLGSEGIPRDLALGLTHSTLLLANPRFIEPVKQPVLEPVEVKVQVDMGLLMAEILVSVVRDEVEVLLRTEIEKLLLEKRAAHFLDQFMMEELQSLAADALDNALSSASAVEIAVVPEISQMAERQVIDLRDMLNKRELRLASFPPRQPAPAVIPIAEDKIEEEVIIKVEEEVIIKDEAEVQALAEEHSPVIQPKKSFDVYYKEGQDLDICLVANAAKRVYYIQDLFECLNNE
jgi:alpha-tubulin suppressor-like RCC1 family protein